MFSLFLIIGECCEEVCVERPYVQSKQVLPRKPSLSGGSVDGSPNCDTTLVTVSCYEVSVLVAVRYYSFVILT
jgi:hypothetical protein